MRDEKVMREKLSNKLETICLFKGFRTASFLIGLLLVIEKEPLFKDGSYPNAWIYFTILFGILYAVMFMIEEQKKEKLLDELVSK